LKFFSACRGIVVIRFCGTAFGCRFVFPGEPALVVGFPPPASCGPFAIGVCVPEAILLSAKWPKGRWFLSAIKMDKNPGAFYHR
jgi:hypothetical protein